MTDITKREVADLLAKIDYIWKKNEEITKLTHERFNIFSILRKDHDEVMLHSAFLAQLLNKNGSHGFGDAFLKLFVENVLDNDFSFETNQASTYCEKTVTDGRIDIYIDNKSQLLLIENKIYADDQDNQLERYQKHMKSYYPKGENILLYLTLDGKPPSKSSKGGLSDNQFQCISYKKDILPWLSLCLKEAVEVPGVRETIKQYINLIKKLTGLAMNDKYVEEVANVLVEGNNLQCAIALYKQINKAKGLILHNFFENLKDSLNNEMNDPNSSLEEVKIGDECFEYNQKKCENWFIDKKGKQEGFGVFINIGEEDILLHVQAATYALHCGFVQVEQQKEGKFTIVGKGLNTLLLKLENFEKREWERLNWVSRILSHDLSKHLESTSNLQPLVADIANIIYDARQLLGN